MALSCKSKSTAFSLSYFLTPRLSSLGDSVMSTMPQVYSGKFLVHKVGETLIFCNKCFPEHLWGYAQYVYIELFRVVGPLRRAPRNKRKRRHHSGFEFDGTSA